LDNGKLLKASLCQNKAFFPLLSRLHEVASKEQGKLISRIKRRKSVGEKER
jgi:hypothetical protein